jgi:hypothetical protein
VLPARIFEWIWGRWKGANHDTIQFLAPKILCLLQVLIFSSCCGGPRYVSNHILCCTSQIYLFSLEFLLPLHGHRGRCPSMINLTFILSSLSLFSDSQWLLFLFDPTTGLKRCSGYRILTCLGAWWQHDATLGDTLVQHITVLLGYWQFDSTSTCLFNPKISLMYLHTPQ